ncbi:ribonuclease E activity regulator RraA [Marinibactrum halimedae]|uniref:4-hydroxy-4-methyl-2-oxoglutarate aldolase n=1 Tax=Marinibactrum halimedae TaxID=1444977 RepID=A0AA37T4Q6_9GAMM|nr:ribonuclease E activity regulator RraA [Marinibactrum halimedae]MCD9458275.1 ribonuclease E activity regulator RraA [Marinibactrum halimedae]GLS27098.1 putative 4-hydroxy-4-methyl-2-oxoglutarate aldolase [Marinibactrum halimedae]
MDISTPDICDQFPEEVRVLEPMFANFGGIARFSGEAVTVKCFEDNSKVKELAATDGRGKVLVVDGGGSPRRALMGDMIAANAADNGWAGAVIYGFVRDVDELAETQIGIQALGSFPIKTDKRGLGDVNVPVTFAGTTIIPGNFVYADDNGIVICDRDVLSVS